MFHVEHSKDISVLTDFLRAQDISFSQQQIQQLYTYKSLIIEWNQKINLISKSDIHKIVERHFLPSFWFAYYIQTRRDGNVLNILDLGTGSGMPGIVLAICFPHISITLLDSSRKKTLFVRKVVEELNLNASVIGDRIENQSRTLKNKFHLATARAVASIPNLIHWLHPVLIKKGRILTLKGINYREELSDEELDRRWAIKPIPVSRDWLNFSDYLKNKFMIEMEKMYD
ncbi:MAG: 16S rRNA (guanine(527)-N(7))-methyltransferase RsmG [Caldithrix sp.]|nr:16S rRNA (guanine(527)-N(7))-methyltransferase RsmG [Caldithrix sp.]